MNSSILVEGSEYISASRAAKKIGYAVDYIGQLCRANKVTGKLIGRTWYVDFDSLANYKKNRKIGKRKKSSSPVPAPTPVASPTTPSAITRAEPVVMPVTLSRYETESKPFLPQLSKENKVVYTKALPPQRTLVLATSVMLLALIVVNVYQFDKKNLAHISSMYDGVSKVSITLDNSAFVSEALDWVRDLFSRPAGLEKPELADNRGISSQGLVVIPEMDANATAISRIKNSFSDGVNVTFDKENDSGVITPVFSENGDVDSYAFVLVPIESKEENTKKLP